jgi:uncharacterized membrane protein YqiK
VTPDPLLVAILAAAVLVPLLLALLFKALYRVPSADQALIVTGAGAKRTAGTEHHTTSSARSSTGTCARSSAGCRWRT